MSKSADPSRVKAALYAHTSRPLQQTSSQLYCGGKLALHDVEAQLCSLLHTETGKSSVLRWDQANLDRDYPYPARLPFSSIRCIDEVFDQSADTWLPVFCCVGLVTNITLHIPIERANVETPAALPAAGQSREAGMPGVAAAGGAGRWLGASPWQCGGGRDSAAHRPAGRAHHHC